MKNKTLIILVSIIIILIVAITALYFFYFAKNPSFFKGNINITKELTSEEKVKQNLSNIEKYFESNKVIDFKKYIADLGNTIKTLSENDQNKYNKELQEKIDSAIKNGQAYCQEILAEKIKDIEKFKDTADDNFFTIISEDKIPELKDEESTLGKFINSESLLNNSFVYNHRANNDYFTCLAINNERWCNRLSQEKINECKNASSEYNWWDFVFNPDKKSLPCDSITEVSNANCKAIKEKNISEQVLKELDEFTKTTALAYNQKNIGICDQLKEGGDKEDCKQEINYFNILNDKDEKKLENIFEAYKKEGQYAELLDTKIIFIEAVLKGISKDKIPNFCQVKLDNYINLICERRAQVVTDFLNK